MQWHCGHSAQFGQALQIAGAVIDMKVYFTGGIPVHCCCQYPNHWLAQGLLPHFLYLTCLLLHLLGDQIMG
jgi:hypothetical protein